jgi:hypothetical protein
MTAKDYEQLRALCRNWNPKVRRWYLRMLSRLMREQAQ